MNILGERGPDIPCEDLEMLSLMGPAVSTVPCYHFPQRPGAGGP